ncbi:kelch-like protein 2 isoform X1 [Adelges cooleyi]|uniref:kelch-like protein 2 isoform X1 n=1 Tax=Adelges cooleyi TaxID=133065 RepID=UPI00218057A1|nr:kelch-like protein 2 isoform X1 [Adelges cooleyi]XP_050440121.1 kelch-like protein 2 isoform X1 [Adelges cooleyi]
MEVSMQKHFERMYQFYKHKEFCDVTLVTDEGLKIEAHRNVLASASHVFYKMLSGHFKEKNENEILIKEIDSTILELVVEFAYTYKLDVKENNCEKLLMAAEMYDVSGIRKLCCKYIKKNINPTNCVRFMKKSKLISDKNIYNFCWSYFLKYFFIIVTLDQALETLYDFEFDDVVEFIARDDLVIDSEEKIFDFIVDWIRYNTDERNGFLPNFMKYLRLPSISKKGLQRIYNHPLVGNNTNVMRGILDNITKTYIKSKPPVTLGRCTQESSNIIFAINGDLTSGGSSVKYMDIRNDNDLRWKSSEHLFFLPPRKDTTMVVSENGIILAIGGLNESGRLTNLVDELDLKSESKQWVSTRPLNRPRRSFGVCTYKQYIYVVGGCDYSNWKSSNSVEYYNTNSKVWTEITEPMPTARSECSAAVFNNKLYVFGGRNEQSSSNRGSLATVVCYDIENKHWKQLKPMPKCNLGMSLSRIDNVIYLIGGSADESCVQRVMKFDLQNFKFDEMPNMTMDCKLGCASVVILKNDLYVFVNNGRELHCERFDKEKNQWLLVDSSENLLYSIYQPIITFNNVTLNYCYGIHL